MRLNVDTTELSEAAQIVRGIPGQLRALNRQTVFKAGENAKSTIRSKYRGAGETTPTSTAVRTRRLLDSYDANVKETRTGVELALGLVKPGTASDVIAYANIHEHDGTTTIRAKNGKYLAIPLDAAKTARGVARGGPRDFEETFFVRGDGGPGKASLVLMQQQGKKAVPLFAMVRQVKVKGRPALVPVMTAQVVPEIEAGIDANFEKAMRA